MLYILYIYLLYIYVYMCIIFLIVIVTTFLNIYNKNQFSYKTHGN